jgi:tryptophan 2,3-dioxygenase
MSDLLYYADYLRLDRILSAQELQSTAHGRTVHDEMLFVIVHQAYELWFKLMLWELDAVRAIFGQEKVAETAMGRALAHLDRMTGIQDLLVRQIGVLETMTPLDFMDFRDYLFPASGFQSVQFRILENKLGVRPADRVRLAGATYTSALSAEDRAQVEASEAEPTLFDLVGAWLERTPFLDLGEFHFWERYQEAVKAMLEKDRSMIVETPNLTEPEKVEQLRAFEQTFAQYEAVFDETKHKELIVSGERRLSHRAFQAALFISLYRDEPALQEPFRLLELLMDIDEGFTTWRHRHAQLATRMIGRRVGTGGSAGAAYLNRSAEKARVFTDLLNLATFLIPRSSLPSLPPEVEKTMHFRFEPA